MKTVTLFAFVSLLCAQVPNPTQRGISGQNPSGMPIYRVDVVARTAKAVNYRHRSGATKVDLRGTALMPEARGDAKVRSKQGRIEIDTEYENLQPPMNFGSEYLTYVLWAITPEGRASNLGEVVLNNNGESELKVTSELQSFGLIVTAEPYFAVTQPSDVVVMENIIRSDTVGMVENIDAKYELLPRGIYAYSGGTKAVAVMPSDKHTPMELYQARNAVRIAREAQAERYAAESFRKAEERLQLAETYRARKAGTKPIAMVAREAAQTAEDARVIAFRRRAEEERVQTEQRAVQAKAEAQQAEADRLAAERAKAEADSARQQAEQARREAETARAAALAQQQAAQTEAERARRQAEEAENLRRQAEADRVRMRNQLREQLNTVLETRETARGLIVNMSDVLFDTGKYTLKPGAREKLAKVAGILMAHPGLKIEVEGHTDNVGGPEFNQRLSEDRAYAVRDYLVSQGVPAALISASGFGKSTPVATNSTAEGRQQNRRVELVVSGEALGTPGGRPAD